MSHRLPQGLERHAGLFDPTEEAELRQLVGQYGLELGSRLQVPPAGAIGHVEARQQHWRKLSLYDRDAGRREVAERAVARLGLILDELDA